MKIKPRTVYLFLSFSLILLAGCVSAVVTDTAETTAVTYINGELRATFDHSIQELWQATLLTVDEFELTIVKQSKDGLNARLHAKGATDKDIYINLKSLTENVTQLRIRIDVFGDEDMSRQLFNAIAKNLEK